MKPEPADPEILAEINDLARENGLHRIHVLAWRDLDDVEAGGSELHIDRIATYWAEAGLDVMMRTSFAAGEPPEVHRHGYRVIRRAGRYLIFPRSIAAEIVGRDGRRDALVEIWNGMPFFSPLWARGPSMVFLHHLHGVMWRGAFPGHPRLAKVGMLTEERLAPPLYRRSEVVTLSESSRIELVGELGLEPERVTVVQPGVSRSFTPGAGKAPAPTAMVVTRLMPSKRVDVALDAFAEATQGLEGAELWVVGTGRELAALRARAERLGIEKSVTFMGRISDEELVAAYQAAWVVISASEREGWGMTLTEAAACGTPCVATDIPGHRDAVADGESGVLVPLDASLGPALGLILSDRAERDRLTEGALAHAARFRWDRTALETFRVLARDAARKRR